MVSKSPSVMTVDSELTEWFVTTLGVEQGCDF